MDTPKLGETEFAEFCALWLEVRTVFDTSLHGMVDICRMEPSMFPSSMWLGYTSQQAQTMMFHRNSPRKFVSSTLPSSQVIYG